MKVVITRHEGERLKWTLWDEKGRKHREATIFHDRKDRIRQLWARINPSIEVVDETEKRSTANRLVLA